MSLQKSHPVRTLLWSGHELTVKSIISCEAKCHAKANGKDDEKLHFEPKVSVFWKCLLTTGIKLYILLPFIELVLAHISPFLKARAGAILEKFAEIKANLTIAVGVQPEVPCQISAQYFSSIFSAGPLKFRPLSTGGRKSEVGILASN